VQKKVRNQDRIICFAVAIVVITFGGCKKAKEVPPKPDFGPTLNTARYFFKSGETEKAIKLINDVLEQDPQNAAAHELLGEIMKDIGEYQKAIASFQEAGRLDPLAFTAHLKQGFTHDLLGEKKKTISSMREGIRIFHSLPHREETSEENLRLSNGSIKRLLVLLPPTRITVLQFKGDPETTAKNYNRDITNLLIKKLAIHKRFQVKDAKGQSKFLEKFYLELVDRSAESKMIGRVLGTDWLVTGSIYQTKDSYQIGLKILQVSIGKMTLEDTINFSSWEDIENLCEEVIKKIIEYTI
jgi:tetratricopeptide (TPR) repeat protein